VIMPSLNVCKYIKQCMDSVLNQTLPNIEILAIDAGSTDGTLEILKEYEKKDSRIKVVLSEQKSYGYQVNKGIDLATGTYISIVETDDMVAENMLELLYDCACKYELDYVKGDFAYWIEFENGCSWTQNMRFYPTEKETYNKVLKPSDDCNVFVQDIFLWRGIYKKSFLQENFIRLNETNGAAFQDQGFLFQTIKLAEKVMYIPEVLYFYRQNNSGSSIYNPKAYSYLVQEYPYIRSCLEKRQNFDAKIAESYYLRLFHQIIGRYRTMAASGILWEGTDVVRKQLYDWVCEGYKQDFYNAYRMGKMQYMELQQYMDSEEGYWRYQLSIYNAKKRCLKEFMDRIRNSQSVVFYSKSIVGGFVYALMKKAGINIPVYFCDNNIEKQGTMYMGTNVYSVAELVTKNPHGLYVIANRRFDSDMKKQLLELGVAETQICVWMLDIDLLLLNMV